MIRDVARLIRTPKSEIAEPAATVAPANPRGYVFPSTGGEKYREGISGNGIPIYIDHYRTRINARNAMHRSTQAKSLVDRFADTVVDTGLRMKPTPIASVLARPEFRRGVGRERRAPFSHVGKIEKIITRSR